MGPQHDTLLRACMGQESVAAGVIFNSAKIELPQLVPLYVFAK